MIYQDGIWTPSPDGVWTPGLSKKGLDIFNSRKRCLLVSGPKWSGKTWSVEHKIIRHLWETKNGRFAVFTKTIKNATQGGIWQDLTEVILPEWFDANLTGVNEDCIMEYAPDGHPHTDGTTRTMGFKIKNYWGGTSELKLFSLDVDGEVEAKVRGTRWSGFWFSELSNFYDKAVFTMTEAQMRIGADSEQLWIADTNPSDENAESWIYKTWYTDPHAEVAPESMVTEKEKAAFFRMQAQMGLIEVMLDDNPFLTDEKKDEIKARYHDDPDRYRRYVNGDWTGTGNNVRHIFKDIFRTLIHVRGDCSKPNRGDWEVLLPNESCVELIGSWDLGQTNHSAHILEKFIVGEKIHWNVLAELVVIGGEVSIEDFTLEFLVLMDLFEEVIRQVRGAATVVNWRHWSDDSAMNFNSAVGTMQAAIVARVSNNRIILRPAEKPANSVRLRIQTVRHGLIENRILVSASCAKTIEMMQKLRYSLKKGVVIEADDKFKHPFDSLSYAMLMESAWEEITRGPREGKVSTTVNVRF